MIKKRSKHEKQNQLNISISIYVKRFVWLVSNQGAVFILRILWKTYLKDFEYQIMLIPIKLENINKQFLLIFVIE